MSLKISVKDIINSMDTSSPGSGIDPESLFASLGLKCIYTSDEKFCKFVDRFTKRYFQEWMCTDTIVGGAVCYYENIPIAISIQNGRKLPEDYSWVSKGLADMIKREFLAHYPKEDEYVPYYIDEAESIPLYYSINYASQLTNDIFSRVCIWEDLSGAQRRVKFAEKQSPTMDRYLSNIVDVIEEETGIYFSVTISDVKIPLGIKGL